MVRENAVQTANSLVTRSCIIREAVQGDLAICPAWYVLETGKVEFLA